jgi:hypothetical protein
MSQLPDRPAKLGLLSRAWAVIVLLALYAFGVWHWTFFFNAGAMTFESNDWFKEHAYYNILSQAVHSGQLPYHINNEYQETDRFLGLPEINVSPQIVLLLWLDLGRFMLADTLLLYSLGFLGCLLIRRRYRLGLVPYAALSLLFFFNGFITSHLGIGHSMWEGYFLLPFVCLFVLEMVEGGGVPAALKLALVLSVMMLQGSFHMVIWCWLFVLFLAVFHRRHWMECLLVFAFSGWLSLWRILPAAVTFWGIRDREFYSGYPCLTDLLDALITPRDHNYPVMGSIVRLGWWEYDMYVGLFGLTLLLYGGVYLRFRDDARLAPYRYPALDAPLLALGFLSLDYFYGPVANLPIPLFNVERVSSRFFIIPLVMLLVIASVRLQRVLEGVKWTGATRILVCGALLETMLTLYSHSHAWRIARMEADWGGGILHDVHIVSRPDWLYITSIQVSAVVSLCAVPVWVFAFVRSRGAAATAKQNGVAG